MNYKEYLLTPEILVKVVKRKKARRIKITLENDGGVRVSIPYFVPYQVGINFAKSKINWIMDKRVVPKKINEFEQVGKSHRISLEKANGQRITTKLENLTIKVFIPEGVEKFDSQVQSAIRKVSRKALLKEATELLPQRVEAISNKHGFKYTNIGFKYTKSRWGSCDNLKNLNFNPNMMNLPWDLIDYVIVHELCHTRKMHHQPDFWQEVENIIPNFKEQRKRLKEIRDNI
jgi:predicted metal-dependent hydrolase